MEKTTKSPEVSDKLKLSLLQIEKRFIDLEIAIGEISEKIKTVETEFSDKTKDVGALPDMQQRVADLEDLIMVEQAGIMELKKMLEEASAKLQQPQDILPEWKQKFDEMEKSVKSITEKAADRYEFEYLADNFDKVSKKIDATVDKKEIENIHKKLSAFVDKIELDEELERIKRDLKTVSSKGMPSSVEMESLHDRLKNLEGQLATMRPQIEGTMRELYERVKNVEERPNVTQPTVDFDLISSKIAALKIALDDLTKRSTDAELKTSEFDQKLELIETKIKEGVADRVFNDINLNRKDIISTNVRVDSLERVARDMMTTLQSMENSVKKIESLDKVMNIGREVEKKIERFKFIEEETRRLSAKVEMLYSEMDKKFGRLLESEKSIPAIKDTLTRLQQETDKNKIEISNRIKREDVAEVFKELDKLKVELTNRARKEEIEDIKKSIESPVKLFDKFARKDEFDFLKKVVAHTAKEEEVENVKKSLEKIHSEYKKVVAEEFNKLKENLPNIVNEIDKKRVEVIVRDAERVHSNIEKKFKEMEEKQKYFVEQIKAVKPQPLTELTEAIKSHELKLSGLSHQTAKLEEEVRGVEAEEGKRVPVVQTISPIAFDEQFGELLDRLVFLESRIAGVEKLIEDQALRMNPIIIE